jgi:hypothetical protein
VLYSIGATWNPKMSQPDKAVESALYHNPARAFSGVSGLAGIKGLSFAYRLQQWGSKMGPSMLPANAYPTGFAAPVQAGLASPLTWVEGVFGVEAPSDMVNDAANSMTSAIAPLSGVQTQIQSLLGQAQGYDGATDPTVQSKAQGCESEATGLLNVFSTLEASAQGILTAIQGAAGDPNVTKATAQGLQAQVSTLSGQIQTFLKGVSQLQSDVAALVKYATAGPGIAQTLETAATSSISTLTWIVGGGMMAYLLLPSFLPRIAGGVRKSL